MKHCTMTDCLRTVVTVMIITMSWFGLRAELKTITINFNESDFNFDYGISNELVIQSQKFVMTYPSDTTKVPIPYASINVLMPGGANFLEASCVNNSAEIGQGVELAPFPEYCSGKDLDSKLKENKHRKMVYDRTSDEDRLLFTGQGEIQGFRVFHFLVRPFEYEDKTLFINQEVEISIEFDLESEILRAPDSSKAGEMSDYVINGEDVEAVCQAFVGSNIQDIRQSDYNCLDYAIITSKALGESFKPLMEWKNMKGVKTEIFYVEDIYNEFPDEKTAQLKIKRFLHKLYRERDVSYVLLGGDATIIPVQEVLCKLSKSRNMVSDMFYSSFQGCFDWNKNGNNDIGEIEDGVRFYSDVYLTRATVRSPKYASIFVNKVMDYERFPPIDRWRNDLVMSGVNMFYKDTLTIFDRRGTELRGDMMCEKYIRPYWDGGIYKFYDTHSDLPEKCVDELGVSSVLSSGHTFFNMFTHGLDYNWDVTGGKYMGDSIFYVRNYAPTVITSGACHVNNFYNTVSACFGECALRSPTNSVISFYGATAETYYMTSVNTIFIDGTPSFIGNFYKNIFTSKYYNNNLGYILANSKKDFIAASNDNNIVRWNMFSMNMLGDPEMPIFFEKPKEFKNISIKILNKRPDGKVSIKLNIGEPDCRIGITTTDDNGNNNYSTIYESNWEYRLFEVENKDVTICITKSGFIPYIIKFNPECLYIQNETLKEGKVYMSPEIKIGSDVTDAKSFGDVTIKGDSKGKYIFRASEMELKSGINIETGAEVEMINEQF